MFREDICVALVDDDVMRRQHIGNETLKLLMDVLSFTHETPRERIIGAVKEEVDYLLRQARQAVDALRLSEVSAPWVARARQALQTNTCYFPRQELEEFCARLRAHPEVASEPGVAQLIMTLEHWVEHHRAFERRLGWLLQPNTLEEVQQLDPKADCDQIFHFISYDFRAEMKIFAVLYELRATVGSSLPTFFASTDEFVVRAVRRIIDTVLLFANALEFGLDSYRGSFCIQRINEIHGRYYIPNDGFRYVLSGIMFMPHEWNGRFGWRKFTEVEKLGWFHAFAKMGRAMNIQDISDDFDEMYAWYKEYSRKNASPAPQKRQLFDLIVTQVLAEYPPKVRPLLLTAILAGMDDVYHVAVGYPKPPQEVYDAMKAVFFTVGHAGAAMPRGPWIRSLQSNPIYPYGYRIEELGVPSRASTMPSLCPYSSMAESLPRGAAHQLTASGLNGHTEHGEHAGNGNGHAGHNGHAELTGNGSKHNGHAELTSGGPAALATATATLLPAPAAVDSRLAALPRDDNHGYPAAQLPLRDEHEARPVELPIFSWEEVRRHAGAEDLWVVVDGYVYDLTNFLQYHPGGAKILLRYGGQDATRAFGKAPHTPETQIFKLNYRIGRVLPEAGTAEGRRDEEGA